MKVMKCIFSVRMLLLQLPSFLFYWLFSWIYPTGILRQKAALALYPLTRQLILRRSGIPIGRQTEIMFGITVLGRGRVPPALEVGSRVAIGPHVAFVTSSYPGSSRLGTHPDIQRAIKRFAPIQVHDDAWIGAGAIILPGVTLGRCSAVSAGSVVVSDVPPYQVVGGSPARAIRQLSDKDQGNEA